MDKPLLRSQSQDRYKIELEKFDPPKKLTKKRLNRLEVQNDL